jgi:uncharacterized membrane protein
MPPDTQLVIGPNASLSVRQAWLVMGGLCLVGLGIAGGFTLLGFWPVLPFAGLELVAVGAALWVSMRRNRYREVVRFDGEVLRIEFGMLGQGASSAVELPRSWAQLVVERGATAHEPSRLWLRCSGQRVEIGRCLTEVERERLAGRIRQLLNRTAWPAGANEFRNWESERHE